jgi:hypothetical protein
MLIIYLGSQSHYHRIKERHVVAMVRPISNFQPGLKYRPNLNIWLFVEVNSSIKKISDNHHTPRNTYCLACSLDAFH